MPVRSREVAPACPDCGSTDVTSVYRSIDSPVQCHDCGLAISREAWDTIFRSAASRQRVDSVIDLTQDPVIAQGIPVAASAIAAPLPCRNGVETVTHEGERVVFVPSLGNSFNRVLDAGEANAAHFVESDSIEHQQEAEQVVPER